MMLGSPAGLEEVINYADFKQEATLESIEDELTLEDEPDDEDLLDFVSGNITVNESRIIIIPTGKELAVIQKYRVKGSGRFIFSSGRRTDYPRFSHAFNFGLDRNTIFTVVKNTLK